MRGPERLADALMPKRWPLRWRVAAASAALTLIILVAFAVVVGRLTSNRLHRDFRDDVRGQALAIASSTRVANLLTGERVIRPPDINRMPLPPSSAVRIVDRTGNVLPHGATIGAPNIGPPDVNGVQESGGYEVASYPVPDTVASSRPIFIQYARSTQSLDDTINRLWLFLALGVVGGTALAGLAGIAIAGRAMRPIANLTATAREIAFTRDPSRRIPKPEIHDEVGELATTLDQMLRQLDAARSETEQMMQAQREFVADASHELRTPLTSILANLELLQERLGPEDPGEDREIVESALRSSRRMRRLVADLLLLARADAGRAGAHERCDLAEITGTAVSEVRPMANGRKLSLSGGGSVPIQGNPDELHRMAVNLLDNGLRHTPTGTEIKVAVGRRNGEAVLEVSDDGPGIPPGMESLVFSRFVRGNGPADIAGDAGAGLGLAIVKAVARSHGGDVEAGASEAGGARFTVHLPSA
jgi:two-component system OmpR family sensor kinase